MISSSTICLVIFGIFSSFSILPSSFAENTQHEISSFHFKCNGNYYKITSNALGSVVSDIKLYSNEDFVFYVNNSTKGDIVLVIPKDFMLSGTSTGENPIVVLENGNMVKFKDASNSTHWILDIPLVLDGSFDLQVSMTGTPEETQQNTMQCSVVPEFGQTASWVLLASIASVTVLFAKSKLGFNLG